MNTRIKEPIIIVVGFAILAAIIVFSPPDGPVANTLSAQAHHILYDDPNDIPYWPSIPELQWFAGTKPDGLFRKTSQDDYEARRWVWYCDQCAIETWPEVK